MKIKNILTVLIFAIATTGLMAGDTPGFLNVDITAQQDEGAAPTEMKLRIPISLITAMAPQIDEALTQVEMNQSEIDLRAMWAEVRNSGPNRFAEIQSDEANVTIDTTETHMNVSVESATEGNLQIEVPLALGDALLSVEEANAETLISTLRSVEGDLLKIKGDKVNGRIWVD